MVSDEVIARHGERESLILIGSSNTFNQRTPFTFEQRRKLIRQVVKGVEIQEMPDVNPALALHAESTIPLWIEQIKELERDMGVTFKFYGGHPHDVRFFLDDFETEVVVDRDTAGEGISATEVRELLGKDDPESNARLAEIVDPRIIELAKTYYRDNLNNFY